MKKSILSLLAGSVLVAVSPVVWSTSSHGAADDIPPSSDCTFQKHGSSSLNGPGFSGTSAGQKYCCRKEGVRNHQLMSAPSQCVGRTVSIKNKVCGCYTGYLGRELKGKLLEDARKQYPAKDLKEGDIHPADLEKYQREPQFFPVSNGMVYLERSGGGGICCSNGNFSAIP